MKKKHYKKRIYHRKKIEFETSFLHKIIRFFIVTLFLFLFLAIVFYAPLIYPVKTLYEAFRGFKSAETKIVLSENTYEEIIKGMKECREEEVLFCFSGYERDNKYFISESIKSSCGKFEEYASIICPQNTFATVHSHPTKVIFENKLISLRLNNPSDADIITFKNGPMKVNGIISKYDIWNQINDYILGLKDNKEGYLLRFWDSNMQPLLYELS